MKFRIAAVVGTTAIIAGGLLGVSPAQASALPITITGGASLSATSFSSTPAINDTIVVTNSTSSSATLYLCTFAGIGMSPQTSIANGAQATYTIDSTSYIRLEFATTTTSGCPTPNVLISAFGGGGGGGSSTPSSSSNAPAAPADLMQQVGAASDGKCTSIIDTSLNWAGVTSGGWGLSWAQWLNGGKGGTVCSRSLYYNLNKAAWALRA